MPLCLAPDLPREDPPLPRSRPQPQRWLPVQGAENGIWKDPEHCLLSPVWVVGGDVREGEYPTDTLGTVMDGTVPLS